MIGRKQRQAVVTFCLTLAVVAGLVAALPDPPRPSFTIDCHTPEG